RGGGRARDPPRHREIEVTSGISPPGGIPRSSRNGDGVNCESILERIAQGGADDAAVVAHLEECPNCRLRMASAKKLGEYLRSEEHTSGLQSRENIVCRLLLEKKTFDLVDGTLQHSGK